MILKTTIAALLVSLQLFAVASAENFSYADVAQRFGDTQLDAKSVANAKMQGECLVGLKELNFRKRRDFDPVAEWTNFRAISLLEQFPPCQVLIMMEVARKELLDEGLEQ